MRTLSHRPPDLAALRRKLAALPAAAEAAIRPALAATAARVAADVETVLDEAGAPAHGVSIAPTPAGLNLLVTAPAARALEFGTSRRASRPFLRAAALRVRQRTHAALAAALRRAMGATRDRRP